MSNTCHRDLVKHMSGGGINMMNLNANKAMLSHTAQEKQWTSPFIWWRRCSGPENFCDGRYTKQVFEQLTNAANTMQYVIQYARAAVSFQIVRRSFDHMQKLDVWKKYHLESGSKSKMSKLLLCLSLSFSILISFISTFSYIYILSSQDSLNLQEFNCNSQSITLICVVSYKVLLTCARTWIKLYSALDMCFMTSDKCIYSIKQSNIVYKV